MLYEDMYKAGFHQCPLPLGHRTLLCSGDTCAVWLPSAERPDEGYCGMARGQRIPNARLLKIRLAAEAAAATPPPKSRKALKTPKAPKAR